MEHEKITDLHKTKTLKQTVHKANMIKSLTLLKPHEQQTKVTTPTDHNHKPKNHISSDGEENSEEEITLNVDELFEKKLKHSQPLLESHCIMNSIKLFNREINETFESYYCDDCEMKGICKFCYY